LNTYVHDSEIFREFNIACIKIRSEYDTFISQPKMYIVRLNQGLL
jgi:hypothetical protein